MHDRSTRRPADRAWRTRRLASLGLLVIVGVLVAGCGDGSSSPGVAHTGSSTPATTVGGGTSSGGSQRGKALLAWSSCMRAHGLPDFPDPQRLSNGFKLPLTQAIMESPKFASAKQACRSLEPGAGGTGTVSAQEREQALKLAACMRSHGVPKFADPTFENGGVRFEQGAGVDTSSPEFQEASQQCERFRPGGGGR
jgi:hypothetical protein